MQPLRIPRLCIEELHFPRNEDVCFILTSTLQTGEPFCLSLKSPSDCNVSLEIIVVRCFVIHFPLGNLFCEGNADDEMFVFKWIYVIRRISFEDLICLAFRPVNLFPVGVMSAVCK